MLHRRQILKSGVAAAALGAFASPLRAMNAQADAGGVALNKLFDQFMTENLDMSPVGATFLGVDTGPRAKQRGEIDDNSLAGYEKAKALTASQLARLDAFNSKSLSGMDEINYEIIQYGLQIQDGDNKKYNYGGGGAGRAVRAHVMTQGGALGGGRRGARHGAPRRRHLPPGLRQLNILVRRRGVCLFRYDQGE